MPITKKEFEEAKLEKDGNDKLTIEIFEFLKKDPKNAYSTKELCDLFKCENTDIVLIRCQRLQKQRKLDGFRPKHSRMFYWTIRGE